MIRTFAPLVAGLVKMHAGKFTIYNIMGSFLWVISIVTAGYLLGENTWVKANLEYIILIIIVITTVPLLIKTVFQKKVKNGEVTS